MSNLTITFTTTGIFEQDLISELLNIGALSAEETKPKGEDMTEVVAVFDRNVEAPDGITTLEESGITNIPYVMS
ncbi:hypothetical protein ACLSZ5_00365 [Avibacterium avium]|uniref:hypothetical protein n=1 Tax=Avibacterium avium TaxID=751 RepID=UPI003BF8C9C0